MLLVRMVVLEAEAEGRMVGQVENKVNSMTSATLRLALRGVKFITEFFSFLDIFFEDLLFYGKGHHYWSWDSK
eukprot:scaffold2132_cov66-Cyclotella_meneghiniana.AAC.11